MVSVAVTRKPFSAPVSLERIDSRAPLASLMMVAVTPAPEALILSRMASRLVSPAPISIVTGVLPVLAVKPVVVGEPVQVPISMVIVPSPTAVLALVKAWLASVCWLARACTCTA